MRSVRTQILVFLALAFGLSWLVALPLWLGDGLADPTFPFVSIGMMATPALAALAVVLWLDRSARPAVALGIRPIGPMPRFLRFLALGFLVSILLVVQALLVGVLLGRYTPDLVDFSGFRHVLEQLLDGQTLPVPIGVLVAGQLGSIVVGSLINTIPALGEEIGWRGWLLPRLLPLGTVPALLLSGVIWGLWHAPLILLGYNYPGVPGWWGVLMMCGMCILVGAVFGWLRLRSGSVWPAAVAHGTFNAAAGMSLLFSSASAPVDTVQATILGWSGWIVPLVVITVLVLLGAFRPRRTNTPA